MHFVSFKQIDNQQGYSNSNCTSHCLQSQIYISSSLLIMKIPFFHSSSSRLDVDVLLYFALSYPRILCSNLQDKNSDLNRLMHIFQCDR